jgi:hypothetical protein
VTTLQTLSLIRDRDTPTDSYRGKEPDDPAGQRHGVADAPRFAGDRPAAAAPAPQAPRYLRPRLRVRRGAGPVGVRERAQYAQPVRDRVGAPGHQLHRHEARLRRGMGRRHRQDGEPLSLSLSLSLTSPPRGHSDRSRLRRRQVGIHFRLKISRRVGTRGEDLWAAVQEFSVGLPSSRKVLTPLP